MYWCRQNKRQANICYERMNDKRYVEKEKSPKIKK